jgi:hypothetical protein
MGSAVCDGGVGGEVLSTSMPLLLVTGAQL